MLLPISFFLLYLRPKRESINLFTKCVGVAAALSLADYARAAKRTDDEIVTTATLLRNARPTAVNLMFAIDKMIQVGQSTRDFSPEKYEKRKEEGGRRNCPTSVNLIFSIDKITRDFSREKEEYRGKGHPLRSF